MMMLLLHWLMMGGDVAVHGAGGGATPDAVLDGSRQLPAAADSAGGDV